MKPEFLSQASNQALNLRCFWDEAFSKRARAALEFDNKLSLEVEHRCLSLNMIVFGVLNTRYRLKFRDDRGLFFYIQL
jgi:hypothetical protein